MASSCGEPNSTKSCILGAASLARTQWDHHVLPVLTAGVRVAHQHVVLCLVVRDPAGDDHAFSVVLKVLEVGGRIVSTVAVCSDCLTCTSVDQSLRCNHVKIISGLGSSFSSSLSGSVSSSFSCCCLSSSFGSSFCCCSLSCSGPSSPGGNAGTSCSSPSPTFYFTSYLFLWPRSNFEL